MQLYIGNKNYSSWSLRAWLLMRQADLPFEEVKLRLDFDAESAFKKTLATLAPAGRVPVLIDDGFAVWDTLAIAEYLAEKFADKALWPVDRHARARARSICAEMHGGFGALRNHCPMNIEASLPAVGERLLRELPALRADLARIAEMWQDALSASGGPLSVRPLRCRRRLLRAGLLAHHDLRADAARATGGLCRPDSGAACDAGLECRSARRERLHRGRRALSTARLAPGHQIDGRKKRRTEVRPSDPALRAGSVLSNADQALLRRRATNPIAPRPASISA